MGERDDRSRPEQPRIGLVDRWLTQRSDPPVSEVTDAEVADASREFETTPTVAGARSPDPVLMAKLAAMRAAEQADSTAAEPPLTEAQEHPETGTLKDRLAARRAQLGQVRRDAGAAVLSALDRTDPEEPGETTPATSADGTTEPDAPGAGEVPAPSPDITIAPASAPAAPEVESADTTSDTTVADDQVGTEAGRPPGLPGMDERRARLAQMVRKRLLGDVADAGDVAPSTSEPPPEVDDHDVITALRRLPMTSADAVAQQKPEHGRHRGPSAAASPTPDPSNGAGDPALQAALRAVEAAEQAGASTKTTSRAPDDGVPVPESRSTVESPAAGEQPCDPSSADPSSAAPTGPDLRTPESTAPEDDEPVTRRNAAPVLDPAIAAALRARMGIEEEAASHPAPQETTPRPATSMPVAPEVARPAPVTAQPAPPAPSPSPEDRGRRAPTRDLGDAPTSPKAPPGVVQFRTRRSTRQLLGMLTLLCFLGTIGTGFLAWDTRGTTEIAIACTLGVMTLILWSAFSTAAPATLTIDRGLLDIVSKESRHRFDLASPYTEITVKGRPGKRGWQVQIHRRSMKPYVIDSSMVDPEEFQPVLEHYREIAAEAALENERRREQR